MARKQKSAKRKSTPAGKLLEMIATRHIPQALHAVAVLGIADSLADGPKDSNQLAQQSGTHASSLYRVLRTLAGAAVLLAYNGLPSLNGTGRREAKPFGALFILALPRYY